MQAICFTGFCTPQESARFRARAVFWEGTSAGCFGGFVRCKLWRFRIPPAQTRDQHWGLANLLLLCAGLKFFYVIPSSSLHNTGYSWYDVTGLIDLPKHKSKCFSIIFDIIFRIKKVIRQRKINFPKSFSRSSLYSFNHTEYECVSPCN